VRRRGGAAASDIFPNDAATDLLLRRAPRTRSGALARGGADDVATSSGAARPRPQLSRRAGPSRDRQDLCRFARDRASRGREGLPRRRGRAVARRRGEHARARRRSGRAGRRSRRRSRRRRRRTAVHGDREGRLRGFRRRAPGGLRDRRHRVGSQPPRARAPGQPRPPRHRRGGQFSSHPRSRSPSPPTACCCSAIRSNSRR
jgi:hypothetical protein